MPEIRRLLANAAQAETSPPAPLAKVLEVSEINFSVHISRLMAHQFDAYAELSGTADRLWIGLAWWFLTMVYFTDSELVTLYLSQSYMGNNIRGFNAAAPVLLGVSLDDVSVEQAARLVVIARSPSSYLGNQERLSRAADGLASRIRNRH